MFITRQSKLTGPTNTIWRDRIGGRRFRDAPADQLSASDGDIGELGQHLGDWCGNCPEATLITSQLDGFSYPSGDSIHAPVLDLDVAHLYFPSTTPGHGALLINVQLTRDEHEELLEVLERLGIIQHGFAEASRQRGYAAVRTPWTDKVVTADMEPDDHFAIMNGE